MYVCTYILACFFCFLMCASSYSFGCVLGCIFDTDCLFFVSVNLCLCVFDFVVYVFFVCGFMCVFVCV